MFTLLEPGLGAFAEDEDPTKAKGSCERHPIGAGKREGPADIAAQVEDREARGTGVPREERIAGPGGDAGQLRELAGPFALAAPGGGVGSRGVKDAQFVGPPVRDDEALSRVCVACVAGTPRSCWQPATVSAMMEAVRESVGGRGVLAATAEGGTRSIPLIALQVMK